MQLSVECRNAALDAYEATTGASPLLQIFDGSLPADTATPDDGNKIAEGTLPANWMQDAAVGQKLLAGAWVVTGLAAAGAGTNGTYFRLYDSGNTVCHMQGTFGETVEEMVADNANIAFGQISTVVTFTWTAGGA